MFNYHKFNIGNILGGKLGQFGGKLSCLGGKLPLRPPPPPPPPLDETLIINSYMAHKNGTAFKYESA